MLRHSRTSRFAVVCVALAMLSGPAAFGQSTEPGYCDPAAFSKYEIANPAQGLDGLERLRAYRLGNVVLAGLAVGHSRDYAVRELAKRYAPGAAPDKYCTWYINKGNHEAERTFDHHYVPNPKGLNERTGPPAFMSELEGSFDHDATSFVACAEKYGYIAEGCNGQRHRGPTLFGMILAYSGCTPEHSAEIANAIWGLNDVAPEVRLAIIRAAYELGRENVNASAALAAAFRGEVTAGGASPP
jgi:hypothetical protein